MRICPFGARLIRVSPLLSLNFSNFIIPKNCPLAGRVVFFAGMGSAAVRRVGIGRLLRFTLQLQAARSARSDKCELSQGERRAPQAGVRGDKCELSQGETASPHRQGFAVTNLGLNLRMGWGRNQPQRDLHCAVSPKGHGQLLGVIAPNQAGQPGQEYVGAERLGQVLVRSVVQGPGDHFRRINC